jgi:hypothetical protein
MNKIQKFYFDKIRNNRLRTLIKDSYTFKTMDDSEKLDLLISASVANNDSNAEQKLIAMFEKEQNDIQEAAETLEPLTPEKEQEQLETVKKEVTELKNTENELKRLIRKGEEKKEQKRDEIVANNLLNKLK